MMQIFYFLGNNFGNIAVDDVSFRNGPCPVIPQTAAKDSGDCSFEENMCSWNNPAPQVRHNIRSSMNDNIKMLIEYANFIAHIYK